jgi:aspartoacylase
MKKIDKVMIVGGTHGNEFTGIYLIKKYQKFPHLISRSNFETFTLFANPKSFELVKRYVETDLNRCFKIEDLANPDLIKYEQLLAKKIAQHFAQEKIDFTIDLHSTTSNMGLTIIVDDNFVVLQLAAYLNSINPSVKILQYSSAINQKSHLRSLGNFNLAIEVGAIANGVLEAKLFQETEILIQQILDYIELSNQDKKPILPDKCTVYRQLTNIGYPRDENGEIKAMIAPELQDYQPLKKGDRLFLDFNGEEITYQGDSVVYPVFISEAAYIEKSVAMSLTEKLQIQL